MLFILFSLIFSADFVPYVTLESLLLVPVNTTYLSEIIKEISKVFGVASISPAEETAPNMEDIFDTAAEYMQKLIDEKVAKSVKLVTSNVDDNTEQGESYV